MRLRWWRRTPPTTPRANPVTIAVLEHDLYDTQPEPGSMAAAAVGLRALATCGVSTREMMHAMTDCAATGTIALGDQPARTVCNLPPGHTGPHHDLVLGDWSDDPT